MADFLTTSFLPVPTLVTLVFFTFWTTFLTGFLTEFFSTATFSTATLVFLELFSADFTLLILLTLFCEICPLVMLDFFLRVGAGPDCLTSVGLLEIALGVGDDVRARLTGKGLVSSRRRLLVPSST